MAYIVDYSLTYAAAAAANTICNMPQHQTGDLLLAIVTLNSGAPSTGTGGTAGWATWVTNATVTANTSGYSWLKATAANNTLSLSTGDDYCCTIISIRDWDGTTPFDVTPNISGSTTASSAPANVAITPTNNNTLAIYMMSVTGVATAVHSPPGFHNLISYDNQGTNDTNSAVAQSVCWTHHRTGGTAVPVPTWDSSFSGAYARMTFAIRNATAGTIPAYIDRSTLPATKLFGGHTVLNGVSLTGSNTMTGNMTNGKTTGYVAGSSANGADLGVNPFSSGFSKASATQAATGLTGFEVNVGTQDFTNDLLVGSVIGGNPKMGAFGIGSVDQGGCVVRIGTAASVWKAYQVAAKDASPSTAERVVFTIKPGYTTTQYGTAGTYTGGSATTLIQLLSNQPSFSSTVIWSEFYRARAHIIAGGDATTPVDTDGMASIGKSYRLPVIQKNGAYGLLSYVPIQIGGGDAVNFQIDAGALQFPRRYDATKKEIGYHAPDNSLGISYAGKSGDVIHHTNSVVTSPTPYYWSINAAATSAADWNFTGTTVVNAAVTLRNVYTFESMSFSDCVSIDASGTTVKNSNLSLVSTTNNPLTVTSTTVFDNCDFNTTRISAGIGMVSLTTTTGVPFQRGVTDPNSGCTFTGSSTTGHAIIITQPGTYAFSNMTFTGYGGTPGDNPTPNSGSTSAAVYNNSGGAVIIQVTGGSQPSVRNGASATTDVQSSANVTISGLVADSEVRAYTGTDPATAVEIAGTESSTGTSFTFTQSSSGVAGYIQIFHVEYQPIYLLYTYLGTNDTITVQQIKDRQYARGTTFTPT